MISRLDSTVSILRATLQISDMTCSDVVISYVFW